MSTFNGQVLEFPDIRVDFFRHAPNARPPLACFLSHVHSDHLAGLESLKAPFVYCTAATREILLRLERFPHRVNFQLGILQSRVQHYRHLKNLLKPLPLETPTRIELAPGKEIQVTLFDANHCTGSCMFLIEGHGKAVLHTGDIRCEPWFVNGLRRNPILMEYTNGIKKLDCVYLDTTFLDDIHFATKADGLSELLKKIRKYPAETTFHFTAWTFGYEEVWIALSKALKSPIHVDQYKLSLYKSLRSASSKLDPKANPAYFAAEAPALIGHHYGNNYQNGCLTLDPTVRIHSCEKGMRCPALTKNTVFIQPILARGTNGVELLELGAGGGQGDLAQKVELEIDSDVFVQRISNFFKNASKEVIDDMKSELTKKLQTGRNTVKLEDLGIDTNADEMSLEELVQAALSAVPHQSSQSSQMEPIRLADDELPRMITFPYSRHASFEELCDLVSAFQPADVYPCTVDERKWFAGVTMKSLFGQCCDESVIFRHDSEMQGRYGKPISGATQTQNTQTQHRSQVNLTIEEPLSKGLQDRIPDATIIGHKRKAEDSLPRDDKRVRELSPVSNGSVDLDAWHHLSMDVDKSDEDWETDDVDSHDLAFWMYLDDEEANNMWDPVDEVWRCKECGWEKWCRFRDCQCEGDFGVSVTEDKEMSKEGFQTMHTIDGAPVDIDLMDTPSNYDSVSDAAEDKYEVNSFIGNSSASEDESSENDEDYEVDDKKRYLEALSIRNKWNRQFVLTSENFREAKAERMGYDSDYDTDVDVPIDVPKNDDSDSEAQAPDPDYRYLYERMKKNATVALDRSHLKDKEFDDFRRSAPGYISERYPYKLAYDDDFDSEVDIPRSQPKKSDAENEILKKKWAKECEKFLRLYKELLATKMSFRELRESILGEGNDKYRDVAGKDHLDMMENMNVEPLPYGTGRPYGLFGDEDVGFNWELLWRRAHMRVHGIQHLLRDERKTFKDWRRGHKEDYVSHEDPYDSEYPTTIGDDDAEAQYLNEDVRSVDSELSDWTAYFYPEIPSLASDGRYRKLWNQSCRVFKELIDRLETRKLMFRKYREKYMGPEETDTYIERRIDDYADKVFRLDDEPRPHGAGKLGRFGNDERGWDWKGLAEKARVRVQQVRRLMEIEAETFCEFKQRHWLDHVPFELFDEMAWLRDDEHASEANYEYAVLRHEDEEENGDNSSDSNKQSRLTSYFSELDNLPWHTIAQKRNHQAQLGYQQSKEQIRIRKLSQTRVTDYIPGSQHLWTARDKARRKRYWPVGGHEWHQKRPGDTIVPLPPPELPPKSPPRRNAYFAAIMQRAQDAAALSQAQNEVQNTEQPPATASYTIKHIGQVEREQISAGITQLEGVPMKTAINLLKKENPNYNPEKDPDLDVDDLSRETLSHLHDLIQQHCIFPALPKDGKQPKETQDAAEGVLNEVQNGQWHQQGLLSVDNNHQKEEIEL